MNKLKILLALGILSVLMFSLASIATVSAYNHATFPLSDNIEFREDISGENRGFSLRRSTDVSRWTDRGYVDWSYRPNVRYPRSDNRISDRLAFQAFKTFSADSEYQNRIQLEEQKRRYSYFGYGYSSRYYGGFGGYRGYGSYGSYYRWGF